jgi:hypothetical protein
MQPTKARSRASSTRYGCMRASKDGGCSLLLEAMWRSPRPSPFEARRPKRPGEHLRVTAKVCRLGNNLLVNLSEDALTGLLPFCIPQLSDIPVHFQACEPLDIAGQVDFGIQAPLPVSRQVRGPIINDV